MLFQRGVYGDDLIKKHYAQKAESLRSKHEQRISTLPTITQWKRIEMFKYSSKKDWKGFSPFVIHLEIMYNWVKGKIR